MKKAIKSATKTIKKERVDKDESTSRRKNTNASTRKGERQRSGNNGPQPGSH
jgi:hypothetical protein